MCMYRERERYVYTGTCQSESIIYCSRAVLLFIKTVKQVIKLNYLSVSMNLRSCSLIQSSGFSVITFCPVCVYSSEARFMRDVCVCRWWWWWWNSACCLDCQIWCWSWLSHKNNKSVRWIKVSCIFIVLQVNVVAHVSCLMLWNVNNSSGLLLLYFERLSLNLYLH